MTKDFIQKLNDEFRPEKWICECGARLDPVSSEWRFDGRNWQHYHGYPIGHVIVEPQPENATAA